MLSSPYIREYLVNKFAGMSKIVSGGQEMVINSLFTNDHKMHMSINLETGLWQCFKTGYKGNFYHLYALLENTTYKKAVSKTILDAYIREDITPKIMESTSTIDFTDELKNARPIPKVKPDTYAHEPRTRKLKLLYTAIHTAWNILASRHLLSDQYTFYLIHDSEDRYHNRIIIPYLTPNKEVFFFQGRGIYDSVKPKYLNALGCKSSNILYPFDYERDILIVVEGPLDCISLWLAGLNSTCINGSSVSDAQMSILKTYPGHIVLALDNDEAGHKGVARFEKLRKRHRMNPFSICYPPEEYKDWNEAWVAKEAVDSWIQHKKVPYTWEYEVINTLQDT